MLKKLIDRMKNRKCKWRIDINGVYRDCNNTVWSYPKNMRYCPWCGEKIDWNKIRI